MLASTNDSFKNSPGSACIQAPRSAPLRMSINTSSYMTGVASQFMLQLRAVIHIEEATGRFLRLV